MRPLKALGQHFLKNTGVVDKIVNEVERLHPLKTAEHPVLEIGPGPGVLTGALLRRGFFVVAVELDPRMVEQLTSDWPTELATGRLKLFSQDALTLTESQFPHPPTHIVGNLPYNVGTSLVFHFLEAFPAATSFCFMLQKEVVERFKAAPNTPAYGVPSVKFTWACELELAFLVSPGSFSPPPKVDSMVFSYRRKPHALLGADPLRRAGLYDAASRFMEGLFQKRRKMLRVSLPFLRDVPLGAERVGVLTPERILQLHLEAQNQTGHSG